MSNTWPDNGPARHRYGVGARAALKYSGGGNGPCGSPSTAHSELQRSHAGRAGGRALEAGYAPGTGPLSYHVYIYSKYLDGDRLPVGMCVRYVGGRADGQHNDANRQKTQRSENAAIEATHWRSLEAGCRQICAHCLEIGNGAAEPPRWANPAPALVESAE